MRQVPLNEALIQYESDDCIFVISVDSNGKPGGMVAGWFMKCSSIPPLFAVSLSKSGYTHTLIRQSKEFIIAVPNRGMEKEVEVFGNTHGNTVDKFESTGIETTPAAKVRSPLLSKATVNFECTLVEEVDSGDHIIFLGEIVASHIQKET